jgi:hypothetical protein
MKVIITENKLKDFIRKTFSVDLTNKIEMVTNFWDIPHQFDGLFTRTQVNRYLNNFGPMYVFTANGMKYLALPKREDGWMIYDSKLNRLSEVGLLSELGLQYLGFSLDKVIDLYFEEY